MADPLIGKLREAGRRWFIQQGIEIFVPALAAALVVVAIVKGVAALGGKLFPLGFVVLVVACGVFFLSVLAALMIRRDGKSVAREADRRGRTKDRFATALDLGERTDAMSQLVQKEAREFAEYFDFRSIFRIVVPSTMWMFGVALLLLAGVELACLWQWKKTAPQRQLASQILERAADQLSEEKGIPELAALEENLRQKAAELQQSIVSDPQREVLAEMAKIRDELGKIAEKPNGLSESEQQSLASALGEVAPGISEALEKGHLEAAARGIENMEDAAFQQAIKRALAHADSARMQTMLRSATARVQLSQALRQAAAGKGERDRLKQMAEALNGRESGDQSPTGEDQKALGNLESMLARSKDKNDPTAGGDGMDKQPGGQPGSERDAGQGEEIHGESDRDAIDASIADVLDSRPGDGPSLVELAAAVEENAISRSAFQKAYSLMAPAAMDSIRNERISPDSRELVKRYFENIRPKESQ